MSAQRVLLHGVCGPQKSLDRADRSLDAAWVRQHGGVTVGAAPIAVAVARSITRFEP